MNTEERREERRKIAIEIFEANDQFVKSSAGTWFVRCQYTGIHMTAQDLEDVAEEVNRRNRKSLNQIAAEEEQAHEERAERIREYDKELDR